MDREIDKLGYVPDDQLRRTWDVRLRHGANITQARQQIPCLLLLLEETGWLDVWQLWQLRSSQPRVADWLDRLGVEMLWGDTPTEKHPPGFRLMPSSWGAFEPGIDALSAFASDLLRSDAGPMLTLRRQLRDADADERHAFLFIGWEYTEGWPLMQSGGDADDELTLPTAAPTLPEPIDGLWLTSMSVATRVIAWLPRVGWIEGVTGRSGRHATE